VKKLKVPSIVTVMILTVITISVWIVFGVVRIFKTTPSPSIPPEILNPLNSSYDKSVVDKIEKRIYFDKEQVFETVWSSPEPTISPEIIPTATPETATGSGSPNI
jgi:hypothetical protein